MVISIEIIYIRNLEWSSIHTLKVSQNFYFENFLWVRNNIDPSVLDNNKKYGEWIQWENKFLLY